VSHDDFAVEPQRGLPAALPAGERLLWQGAPDWRTLALHAYRVRALAGYGIAVIAARAILRVISGTSVTETLQALSMPVVLLALGLGLLCGIAWLAARTTVYTLTDRRVVIRQGIALPVTINLPLSLVDGAASVARGKGTGDVALQLAAGERVSYALMWPHVRPWHWRQPQPMLRAIHGQSAVGALLVAALTGTAPPTRAVPTLQAAPAGNGSLAPA
jgi:Bacterial PH domain